MATKRKEVEMSLCNQLEKLYSKYQNKYVNLYADVHDNSSIRTFKTYYDTCVNKICAYMEDTFTKERIDKMEKDKYWSSTFPFDKFIGELGGAVGPEIISFLKDRYHFTGVVSLDSNKSAARLYVVDSIIERGENLEKFIHPDDVEKVLEKTAKNLPSCVVKDPVWKRAEKINNLFYGFDILKVYQILMSSIGLPANSDFHAIAYRIAESDSISKEFINAVCIRLLLRGSSNSLFRAKIFSYAFGGTLDLSFGPDFESDIAKLENRKK